MLSAVLVLLAVANAPRAFAHPSDFETLTLDLVIDRHGLVVIDAAVVESSGPGYEPLPSVELRRMVAEHVLGALGVPTASASIDATNSERYHEVGFLISLAGHRSGPGVVLDVGSRSLQELTDDLGLARLKVGVCGIDADAFGALELSASRPGRQPSADRQERTACQVWDIEPDEPPVEIMVRSRSLASTGLGASRLVLISTALVLLGFVAIAGGRRIGGARRHAADGSTDRPAAASDAEVRGSAGVR